MLQWKIFSFNLKGKAASGEEERKKKNEIGSYKIIYICAHTKREKKKAIKFFPCFFFAE